MLTAGITSLLFKLFRQPVVLGYIVAGMIVGPYMLGDSYITEEESVTTWGEIGVLFLLFSLGLEFSFKKLIQVGNTALIGATTIVTGMMICGFTVGTLLGWDFIDSLFLGGMLCMSSTTIVFKAIDEAGLRAHQFSKVCFGILIVEDIFAVILMVLLSSIAVKNSFEGSAMVFQILTLLGCLIIWFVSGILVIPTFLSKFKKHLNDETLTLLSIGLCLGMVMLAMRAGFSSALGAFVMGSILAETVDAERIEHLIQPVKNIFGAIFFVSVGMLIDPDMLVQYWVPILIITCVVIIGQAFFGTLGSLLSGQTLRVSMQTGLSLVQIGEFAFIIAALGDTLDVTDKSLYPIVVAVSVITTFLTPYVMKMANPVITFCESHMSNEMRTLLDNYAQSRNKHHDANWRQALNDTGKFIIHIAYRIPVIRAMLRLFSKNLYARETLAKSNRGLKSEVEYSLLCLDIHTAEFNIPLNSTLCGHTLRSNNIRGKTGVTVLSIIRSGLSINIPNGDNRIFPNDKLVIAGTDEQMDAFKQLLENSTNDVEFKPAMSSRNIILDHYFINEGSSLIGKTIIETKIQSKLNCIIMGVVRPDEGVLMNPDPTMTLQEMDNLILAGDKSDIEVLINNL